MIRSIAKGRLKPDSDFAWVALETVTNHVGPVDIHFPSNSVLSGFKREAIPIKNNDAQLLIRWIHVPHPAGLRKVHVVTCRCDPCTPAVPLRTALDYRATPPAKG